MKSPKVTKNVIEQVIDLSEFGVDLSNERSLKEAIAQAMIDRIVSRTEAGDGMSFSGGQGRPVKLKSPYSKEYSESLEFKAAGKKKSEVNMKLTGDMLAAVDVIATEGNKIKIGISDDSQIPKAFNHITGDTVPKRPWFGVNKKEINDILNDFQTDIERTLSKPGESDFKPGNRARIRLLDLFGDDEEL